MFLVFTEYGAKEKMTSEGRDEPNEGQNFKAFTSIVLIVVVEAVRSSHSLTPDLRSLPGAANVRG